MNPFRVIVIGAGNRGERYAELMQQMPEHYKIVGMADPAEAHRDYFREQFGVPAENCYHTWEEILSQPKMADLAVISTVDHLHYETALKAIALGYDLLLEKPVAPTAKECADIAAAAREKGVKVLVCHVLRYAPFFCKVKELLMSGIIGEVTSLDQVEGVGNVHFSHSFVRGNWHCEAESAPMLLAKSCHDIDMIQWLLDKACKRVASFGGLMHFIPENAPEGAPIRCADGTCPAYDTCPYNCIKHYYDFKTNSRRRIITTGISKKMDPTDEEVMQALRTTDYGLCVYHAHNDMPDHQVVSMEFEGGVTASFTLSAFNKGGRYLRIYGTKGELYAHAADDKIQVYTFEDKKTVFVPVLETEESINGGHGGGDEGIIRELHLYMADDYKGYRAADIHTSVRNHLICFAAEAARHGGTVVSIDQFMENYGMENKY